MGNQSSGVMLRGDNRLPFFCLFLVATSVWSKFLLIKVENQDEPKEPGDNPEQDEPTEPGDFPEPDEPTEPDELPENRDIGTGTWPWGK